MWKAAVALLAALCVAACASSGTKVEQSQLQQFEKGKTTYAEVTGIFGAPSTPVPWASST